METQKVREWLKKIWKENVVTYTVPYTLENVRREIQLILEVCNAVTALYNILFFAAVFL